MAQKDPATVAQNWATRLAQSTQAITDGVNAVQVAPGVAAARQKNAYIANVQANAGKWATKTAAVPLGDWQAAMTGKGIPRIGQGATAAIPKMQAFLTKSLPYINSVVAGLPARGDLNANITRMVAFTTKMAQFKNV